MKVYIVGSLKSPERVWHLAETLRASGFDVFDDWAACHPDADDRWQEYERQRGRNFAEALLGDAAQHIASFDVEHLMDADAVVMVAPAGRSAHAELGFAAGMGKRTIVYLTEEPERWDVMYNLFDKVVYTTGEVENDLHSW